MKEIEDANKWKEIHLHGPRELRVLKCPHYSKPPVNSRQSLFNSIFHGNKRNNFKILNSQVNLEKEDYKLYYKVIGIKTACTKKKKKKDI